MSKDLLPGIRLGKGDIEKRVLVCGDPFRAEMLSKKLQNVKCLAKGREYWTYYGEYKGVPINISSHGVGASGAMLSFISLIKGGACAIIRLGTCGSLNENIKAGDIVIPIAAAKEDGVSNIYVPDSFPAIADLNVVNTLIKESEKTDKNVHNGIIVTQGAFYGGIMETNTEKQAQAGAIALEMEVSALYTAGSLYNVKVGSILSVDGNALEVLNSAEDNDPDPEVLKETVEECAIIALDALIKIEI
ncbi:nucleoside phosphorylase [Caviibacter abscessus]|uniref:nucleoside phosphorylase n=1 Tax=Caviibacter abscessus TaxID=1766719 RepID=UPI000834B806|nr:nucleoside phosphorylase [Caviibacter abscessus]